MATADVAVQPDLGHAPPAIPDFDMVARKGLSFPAVVLVALLVVIAADKIWALEFMHVVFGSAWTIVDLFLGFVLGPILGRLSIPARIEMTTRLMPKMLIIMPTLVAATLAAGWQLGVHLGTVQSYYPTHGW